MVERRGGLVRIDGRRGFGQLTGERATELALELAAEYAVAAVAGRDAGHLGRLGAYTERIAAAGMAGILLVNNQGGDQQIAPLGSAERRLTNNPISIGVPGAMLDMALSVAAEGRVWRAHERGEAVPAGWILDSSGAPSTDPAAYVEGGSLLPLGGEAAAHKGQGLIVMVELLVGLLASGGMCRPGEPRFSNSFVLICLAPGAAALDAYRAELPGFVDWVRSAAPLEGAAEFLFPGEPEARARARGEEIELDEPTLRALGELAEAAGLPAPAYDLLGFPNYIRPMECELSEHREPRQGRVEDGRFATLAGTALVTHADMLLALAAEFAPVDSEAALERLDELGRRLFGIAALTPDDAALDLIEVLRFEQGFAVGGGVPAGLMLDYVLEQRRGHPALLAVVLPRDGAPGRSRGDAHLPRPPLVPGPGDGQTS